MVKTKQTRQTGTQTGLLKKRREGHSLIDMLIQSYAPDWVASTTRGKLAGERCGRFLGNRVALFSGAHKRAGGGWAAGGGVEARAGAEAGGRWITRDAGRGARGTGRGIGAGRSGGSFRVSPISVEGRTAWGSAGLPGAYRSSCAGRSGAPRQRPDSDWKELSEEIGPDTDYNEPDAD